MTLIIESSVQRDGMPRELASRISSGLISYLIVKSSCKLKMEQVSFKDVLQNSNVAAIAAADKWSSNGKIFEASSA